MIKKIDLKSRVRAGMTAERSEVSQRLANLAGHESGQDHLLHPSDSGQEERNETRKVSSVSAVDPHPVHSIALSECISNPQNPRSFYSEHSTQALATSLKSDGQLQPVIYTTLVEYPGKKVIVDGERRLRAARLVGWEAMQGSYRPGLSSRDLFQIAYRANDERETQTVFDNAVSWSRVLTDQIYRDQKELAASVGVDKAVLNKTLLLNELPRSIIIKMAAYADTVKLSHAYNIKLIFDNFGEDRAFFWLNEVIEGRASVRKLEQVAAKQKLAAKSPRNHYDTRVKFAAPNGLELGELKAFSDGRAEIKIGGVTAAAQQRLVEKIDGLVKEWLSSLAPEEILERPQGSGSAESTE
ncbi:ParB/RepB/Spo0J family partition protein (plasmid) [Robbsia andropogonis]|uniref:ParB/RepB/Spo0J family partition protein n=1 Tax=Robbsia andropogonis TaxID=28092 RepID=UPI003D1B3FBD